MCLAQGHNAVTPVRLEPVAPRSRVKHSTTEPLRSVSWKQTMCNLREQFDLGPYCLQYKLPKTISRGD